MTAELNQALAEAKALMEEWGPDIGRPVVALRKLIEALTPAETLTAMTVTPVDNFELTFLRTGATLRIDRTIDESSYVVRLNGIYMGEVGATEFRSPSTNPHHDLAPRDIPLAPGEIVDKALAIINRRRGR